MAVSRVPIADLLLVDAVELDAVPGQKQKNVPGTLCLQILTFWLPHGGPGKSPRQPTQLYTKANPGNFFRAVLAHGVHGHCHQRESVGYEACVCKATLICSLPYDTASRPAIGIDLRVEPSEHVQPNQA